MRYGVNAGFREPLPAEHLAKIKGLGLTVCRTEVDPDLTADQRTVILGQFAGSGVEVLLLLCGGDRIAAVSSDALAALAVESVKMAGQLGVQLAGVEVGNEPDIHGIAASAYRPKALAVHAALRQAGYRGPIYAGAVANLERRGLAYLTAMDWGTLPADLSPSVHRYAPSNDPARSHSTSRKAEWDSAVASCAGRIPIVTECGYHTATERTWYGRRYGLTDQQAADAAARDLREYEAWGCPLVTYFQVMDGPLNTGEHRHGLFAYPDWAEKPQAVAVKTVAIQAQPVIPPNPPPSPPPPPPPPTPRLQVAITPWAAAGVIAHPQTVTLQLENGLPPILCAPIPTGQWICIMPPEGQYGHYGIVRVDEYWERMEIAANMNVVLPQYQALPRLEADGDQLKAGGQPFVWAMMTGFCDYQRFLDGEDITPQLQQARDLGANGRRVLGMMHYITAFRPDRYGDAYYQRLPAFVDLLATHGQRLHFDVFADAQMVMSDPLSQREHWAKVCDILRPMPSVVIGLGNEYQKNGFVPEKFTSPGVIASQGSSVSDTAPPMPGWGIRMWHGRRDQKVYLSADDMWFVARGIDETAGHYAPIAPAVHDEPIGFAEADVPGKRSTDPRLAQSLMLTGRAYGAGATFHSEDGIYSRLLGPTQQACARAFFDAQ